MIPLIIFVGEFGSPDLHEICQCDVITFHCPSEEPEAFEKVPLVGS